MWGKMMAPLAAAWLALGAAQAGTLDTVKSRGAVACGVSTGLPGFSDHDDKGNWSGFDVDFCRALAAAVFDDPAKVTYVALNAAERFDALKSGKIDVLSRNSTWTIEREASLGSAVHGDPLSRRPGFPGDAPSRHEFLAGIG